MRRLLFSTACLAPLVLFFGCCNHMAGMCDCAFTPTIACPCYGHVAVPVPVVAKPVEPIKEAPKPKSETPPETETQEN